MLSSLFIDLLSPVFRDDNQIDSLFNRTLEILMLHEGLYPIQECLIVWHQLLDLVPHIKKMGPLKCWWEMSGERFLSTIKKHVPSGGYSYDKCVCRSYSGFESSKLQECYCFSLDNLNEKNCHDRTQQQKRFNNEINNINTISNKNNVMQYADDKFLLIDRINSKRFNFSDMKFNDFELSCMLDEFLMEIKKKCRNKNEARFKSPLYRMYIVYIHFKKEAPDLRNIVRVRNLSFFQFLEFLLDETKESKEFKKRNSVEKNESFMARVFTIEKYTETDYDLRFIIVEDLVAVKQVLVNFAPFRFSKALVFGVLMKSRMITNCEEPYHTTPQLPLNKLKNNWHDPIQISSWFKYRYQSFNYVHDDNFGFSNKKVMYGQFNFF
jgi:hypothetical protein